MNNAYTSNDASTTHLNIQRALSSQGYRSQAGRATQRRPTLGTMYANKTVSNSRSQVQHDSTVVMTHKKNN